MAPFIDSENGITIFCQILAVIWLFMYVKCDVESLFTNILTITLVILNKF